MPDRPDGLVRYDMPAVVHATSVTKSALQADVDGTRAWHCATLPLYLAHQILLL